MLDVTKTGLSIEGLGLVMSWKISLETDKLENEDYILKTGDGNMFISFNLCVLIYRRVKESIITE